MRLPFPDVWCVLRGVDRWVSGVLQPRGVSRWEAGLVEREAEEEVHEPGMLFDAADETDGAGYLTWPKMDGRIHVIPEPESWICAQCGRESRAECAALSDFKPGMYCSVRCANAPTDERDVPPPPHLSWGVDGATSQPEPPLHRQCQRCGDRFNVTHECLRPADSEPTCTWCGHDGSDHQRVGGLIDPCFRDGCECLDYIKPRPEPIAPDSPSAVPPVDGAGPAGVEHSPAPPAGPPNGLTSLIEIVLSEHHDTRELHLDGTESYWCECGCISASPAGHRAHMAQQLESALLQNIRK